MRYYLKTFISAVLIASFLLAAPAAQAINIFDRLLYSEATLKTGTRVLVHRLTGRVEYYWQQGFRWGEESGDPDSEGLWKKPAGQLQYELQQQYDAMKKPARMQSNAFGQEGSR